MFIREFDGHKYRISRVMDDKRTIIAKSSFAGKPVKGIARCHPNNTFDLEKGIKLAILRCNTKIGLKKIMKANKNFETVKKEYENIKKKYADKEEALTNAQKFYNENKIALEKLLREL